MKNKKSVNTVKLVYAAACLAIALVLPFITGHVPEIGNKLCPMHFPIMLCGFICGWPYGLAVGLIAAPLRFLLFSAPPFPNFLFMTFELASYGFFTGLFYKLLPKKIPFIYANLIFSMIAGRIVWGIGRFLFMGLTNTSFSFGLFVSLGFIEAIPGIIFQIILIPIIVNAFRKAKLMPADK